MSSIPAPPLGAVVTLFQTRRPSYLMRELKGTLRFVCPAGKLPPPEWVERRAFPPGVRTSKYDRWVLETHPDHYISVPANLREWVVV